MGKGQEAKDRVAAKLSDCWGEDFVGVKDGKIYVWSMEGGVRTQVCLSMTCPKTIVTAEECEEITIAAAPKKKGEKTAAPWEVKPVEHKVTAAIATDEEEMNIRKLCDALGVEY